MNDTINAMENYYTIFPGPNGLIVKFLGKFDDFDGACNADEIDEGSNRRETSVWIVNDEDLVSLSKSIRAEYKGE